MPRLWTTVVLHTRVLSILLAQNTREDYPMMVVASNGSIPGCDDPPVKPCSACRHPFGEHYFIGTVTREQNQCDQCRRAGQVCAVDQTRDWPLYATAYSV